MTIYVLQMHIPNQQECGCSTQSVYKFCNRMPIAHLSAKFLIVQYTWKPNVYAIFILWLDIAGYVLGHRQKAPG